jgi:hypothetical protein
MVREADLYRVKRPFWSQLRTVQCERRTSRAASSTVRKPSAFLISACIAWKYYDTFVSMSRNIVQTVTLPILVKAETLRDADGWGTFFPARHTGSMAVRVVTPQDVAKRLRDIFGPKDIPLYTGVIRLERALESGHEGDIIDSLERVRPWIKDFAPLKEVQWKSPDGRVSFKTVGQKRNAARWNYSGLMAELFHSAQLVVWWSEKERHFMPALYCPDWKTAAFLLAFMKHFRECPKCHTVFVPSADNVDYCTPRHREAHRVARWRARKRQVKDRSRRKSS